MRAFLILLALSIAALAEPRIVKLASIPVDAEGKPMAGFVALGDGYYDAEERATLPAGAVVLSTGAQRYANLPAEDKPRVLVAEVFRSLDGTDLKARIIAAVQADLVAIGQTLAQLTPLQRRIRFIQKARQFLQANQARRIRVAMAAVTASDVDEETDLPPHQWAGEGLTSTTTPP